MVSLRIDKNGSEDGMATQFLIAEWYLDVVLD
jgi:hypothetical protein